MATMRPETSDAADEIRTRPADNALGAAAAAQVRLIVWRKVSVRCTSYSAPVPAVQAIPPRPTPDEVADYSTAQMQYRYGLATGNGEARTRRERCPRCTSSRSWTAKFA